MLNDVTYPWVAFSNPKTAAHRIYFVFANRYRNFICCRLKSGHGIRQYHIHPLLDLVCNKEFTSKNEANWDDRSNFAHRHFFIDIRIP